MGQDSSYEKINYSLRPAKSVERKMLCEMFQALAVFSPLKNYKYIGFGSTYFSDFSLFHKSLGIENMVSIERDIHNAKRFSFNRPYSCISIEFAESKDVLPTFDWNDPTILWLDYDKSLMADMIVDIQTFSANAVPGSFFLISVNSNPFTQTGIEPENLKEFRIQKLKENIGESRIPPGIDGSDLSKVGLPKVYISVINEEINSIIDIRNTGLSQDDPERIFYRQLVNFSYQDGAQMLTIGGVFFKNSQLVNYHSSNLKKFSFVRENEEHFKIDIPNLTFREIHKLESLLPSNIDLETGDIIEKTKELGIDKISEIIPLRDVQKYAKLYRYFPTFTESNV